VPAPASRRPAGGRSGHVPSEDYDAVATHFGPDEVAALLSLIVTINAWNTIGVATRTWQPGSYEVA
jgi:alkylhydroperoxidase family enzyme